MNYNLLTPFIPCNASLQVLVSAHSFAGNRCFSQALLSELNHKQREAPEMVMKRSAM
jgi:hypothetical protein